MIGAHHSENRNRGRLLIALRWLAAAVVIGVLLRFLPLHLLAEAIRRVPVATFLAILLGYLCAHAVGIAKWRMVVNAAGAPTQFWDGLNTVSDGTVHGGTGIGSIADAGASRMATGRSRGRSARRTPIRPHPPACTIAASVPRGLLGQRWSRVGSWNRRPVRWHAPPRIKSRSSPRWSHQYWSPPSSP